MAKLKNEGTLPLGRQGPESATYVQRNRWGIFLRNGATGPGRRVAQLYRWDPIGLAFYGTDPRIYRRLQVITFAHAWKQLTPTQQTNWANAAAAVTIGSWLKGGTKKPTGFEYFMHLNMLNARSSPEQSNTANPGQLTVAFTTPPADLGNPPAPAGITSITDSTAGTSVVITWSPASTHTVTPFVYFSPRPTTSLRPSPQVFRFFRGSFAPGVTSATVNETHVYDRAHPPVRIGQPIVIAYRLSLQNAAGQILRSSAYLAVTHHKTTAP